MEKPDYYTSVELAGLLRTHVQTIRRWRHKGRGPGYIKGESVSSRVLYPRVEVERWIAEHWTAEPNRGGVA